MGYFYKFKVILFSTILIGIMQMCVNGMQQQNELMQLLSQTCVLYEQNIPYLPIKILSIIDKDLTLSETMGNDLIMLIRDLSKYEKFHADKYKCNATSSQIFKLFSISNDTDLFCILSIFVKILGNNCPCKMDNYEHQPDLSEFILNNNIEIAVTNSSIKQRECLVGQEKAYYTNTEYDTANIMEKDFYIICMMCIKVQEKIILRWRSLISEKEMHQLRFFIKTLYEVLKIKEYTIGAKLLEQI